MYRLLATIEQDDFSSNLEIEYYFRKPKTASYDRYVKTASQSPTKALRAFVMDNVVDEQAAQLEAHLEEYPAFALYTWGSSHHVRPEQGRKFKATLDSCLQEVKTNFIESGMLEIYRFLPPAVLKGKEVGDMDMDELFGPWLKLESSRSLKRTS
ncbi:DUF6848 family protein [Paenibacillus melissococcoides]|uniref:DUF6848 family protein n=1 Tax=Paenibacillus melissococcoides TaxID=2912268 RepID=UPI0021C4AA8A|nr:hypothetical protein [Paenibacillus melissococcoides]CAH8721348.1 hypothetical protein HTL2_006319 [Paenibacillus melissococcoides]